MEDCLDSIANGTSLWTDICKNTFTELNMLKKNPIFSVSTAVSNATSGSGSG